MIDNAGRNVVFSGLLSDNDEFIQEYILYLTTNKFRNRLRKHVVTVCSSVTRKSDFYQVGYIITTKYISLSEFTRMTGFTYDKLYHMYREGKIQKPDKLLLPDRSKKLIMIDIKQSINNLYDLGYTLEANRAWSCSDRLEHYLSGLFSRAVEESGVGVVWGCV